jgi:hypothetical protein
LIIIPNSLKIELGTVKKICETNKARVESDSKNTVNLKEDTGEDATALAEVQAREKALAKEAERVLAREKAVAKELARKKVDAQRIQAEESAKLKSQVEARTKVENKANEDESNRAKASVKFEVQAKALANAGSKTKGQLQELARAREEGRAEAFEEAKNKKKHHDDDKKKKEKKKKHFQKKLDEATKKRLAAMPMCKGGKGGNGTDPDDEKNVIAGTNVFDGKFNATNALGIVGTTNWSINKPPYKVERCDQILLIHGKKLDLADYCIKEDAFMTMSIYMVNFFLMKDANKLLESYPMNDITAIPSALPGAPGCTMWQTKTKSFPFCYESVEILDQVIQAYYKFLNCRKPSGPKIAYAFKNACDLTKMDLSTDGPFGEQGPMYKEIIDAMDPDAGKKKKEDLTGINPYYVHDDVARIPGNQIDKPVKDPRLQ